MFFIVVPIAAALGGAIGYLAGDEEPQPTAEPQAKPGSTNRRELLELIQDPDVDIEMRRRSDKAVCAQMTSQEFMDEIKQVSPWKVIRALSK